MIKNRIDHKMREINPLPKDFDHWIDEFAMAKSRYIYYRYSRRKYMDGYCTHCHQEVKVQGVRHRSVEVCPNCGVKVTFLVEGKSKYICDHGEAAYFQKTPKGFVIRYFSIHKIYNRDYRYPRFSVTELMLKLHRKTNHNYLFNRRNSRQIACCVSMYENRCMVN